MDTALLNIIAKDFDLEGVQNEMQLRDALIDAFTVLIDYNFNKLVQILYKADVDQHQLKLLLEQSDGVHSAVVIADAYIERQKKKLITWAKYSSNKNLPDGE